MSAPDRHGLIANAARRPAAPALVVGGRAVGYRRLEHRVRRVAGALAARAVGVGDRVAVKLPDSQAWFEVVHACGRLDATAVLLDAALTARETRVVLRDADPAAIVSGASRSRALGEVDVPRLLVGDTYEGAVAAADPVAPSGGDGWPDPMLYTSGTTGQPKGVVLPGGDPRRTAAGMALMAGAWGFDADDVHLLAGPLHHSGPMTWAQVHLAVGATVVVGGDFEAARFLSLIDRHEVTNTHLVPAHLVRLLEVPERRRAPLDLSSLRLVLVTGAPCPAPVKRAAMELLAPAEVWEYYGASEGGGTAIGPEEWSRRPGSVGRPFPGVGLRILDEDGREQPAGESGLVYFRPTVPGVAYHGDPEATDAAHRGEWLTVGDRGYVDREGYLYLTGRAGDLIISGGVNVSPREVESVLHRHPAVLDCAVMGVADRRWGEIVGAIVQPQPGAEPAPAELHDWCRTQLTAAKRPGRLRIVDAVPRSRTGKVDREEVHEHLTDGGRHRP